VKVCSPRSDIEPRLVKCSTMGGNALETPHSWYGGVKKTQQGGVKELESSGYMGYIQCIWKGVWKW